MSSRRTFLMGAGTAAVSHLASQKALSANEFEKAKEMLPSVYQALDKAARTNLIKKNKAARLKSRLTRQLNTKSSKTSS